MRRFIHRFKTQEEFNQTYRGSGYTEPWVSCVENSNVNFNNQNYILLHTGDGGGDITMGPKFSISDMENNPPLVYFWEYGNLFDRGYTVVKFVISQTVLTVVMNEKVKGGMNATYIINLNTNRYYSDMGYFEDLQ